MRDQIVAESYPGRNDFDAAQRYAHNRLDKPAGRCPKEGLNSDELALRYAACVVMGEAMHGYFWGWMLAMGYRDLDRERAQRR